MCLSLLGTWNGGAKTEGWSENSTLLQVLVSIQSLIMVKHPVWNEPGAEKQRGTAVGAELARIAENGGYEEIRLNTIRWAMRTQIQHPPKGFEVSVCVQGRVAVPTCAGDLTRVSFCPPCGPTEACAGSLSNEAHLHSQADEGVAA